MGSNTKVSTADYADSNAAENLPEIKRRYFFGELGASGGALGTKQKWPD
jgi:hypothetical protein